ncbi:uncharacterized protein [Eurosta solidaginis]|uniref:uncharacterized protein n=1 Tax=Eurosta solidaginis TaxID=178769 RepID=UPI00353064C2
MDASRQAQYDANNTGASMYLSFDSSMSSVEYKTMETSTNEHLMVSNMDYEDVTPENSQGLNQDSTLEALDSHVDYLDSTNGKSTQQQPSALPSRVLQKFNVVSSTPTKEQLLRSVEVVRGSSAERCVDLRRAFLDMEDKDKENALPLTEVALAFGKQVPPLRVIQEKNLEISGNSMNYKGVGNTSAESEIQLTTKQDGNVLGSFKQNKDSIIVNENNVEETPSIEKFKNVENKRITEALFQAPVIINHKKIANLNSENGVSSISKHNGKVLCTITENEDFSNTNQKDAGNKNFVNDEKQICSENAGAIIKVSENKVSTIREKKDVGNKNYIDTEPSKVKDNLAAAAAKNPVKKDSAIVKNKRTSIPKRPICEPDLLTNRPSRIATNTNKRLSVNDFIMKTNLEKQISTEIPKLMNKVLKIAESTTVVIDKTKNAVVFDQHKPTSYATKGRTSMLPSTALSQAEKRPFAYTQRMSVLVKTTLNSPARKIARRSCAIVGQQNWKSLGANNLPSKSNRKSMLPLGKTPQSAIGLAPPIETKVQTVTNTTTATTKPTTTITNQATNITKPVNTTVKQTTTTIASSKSIPSNRKSIYPNDKAVNELQKPASVNRILPALNSKIRQSVAGAKTSTSFVCSVCGSKYGIKSLLDAHKRSHEGDGPPAFVKKSTLATSSTAASTVSQTNVANKCKYCDKKFALVRALHIHLLQNCPKIPPKEKRKLTFHEMDHVEKAQLPAVFHGYSTQTKANPHQQGLTVNALQHRSSSDLSSVSVSSQDSMNDKRALAEITMIAKTAVAAVDSLLPSEMAPPSARSVKKSTAHTGVHRTPNKSIICHTCKIPFKTIMDHIQHNMKVHFNNSDAQRIAQMNEKITP